MKLTLLSVNEYTCVNLPEKCIGHYWVRGKNAENKICDIVAVEALRSLEDNTSRWMLKSNRRFSIIDRGGNTVTSVQLEPLELYGIRSADGKVRFTLFSEPLTLNRKQYKGYELIGDTASLSIGRGNSNNIVFANKFVSENHAELIISKDGISIRDLGSTNNTYVNGSAVLKKGLAIGDVIYILGLQIIVAGQKFFINNPDGNVSVRSGSIREISCLNFESSQTEADDDFEDIQVDYYYRAPRFKYDVDVYELKVDAPPNSQNTDEMPMSMVLGPSLTMGLASATSGLFSVTTAIGRGDITSAIPSMVMCLSMLLGTTMWPIITKSYQKNQRRYREVKRNKTYSAYIEKLNTLIEKETRHQEQILRENDTNTQVCTSRILSQTPQIWERTPKHTDFLSLRIGNGSLPLKINVQYSERRFTVEHDDLAEMMYEFGESERFINDVPICISLTERFISGFYSKQDVLYSYAKSLILQLVALHSYDEVKLVVIYDESVSDEFSFVRYLPHTMDNDKTERYIATNIDEIKELSSILDPIVEYRKELSENKLEDENIHFVILCLSKELGEKAEFLHRILDCKKYIKFSVLSLYERLVDLPKECTAVVELNGNNSALTCIGSVSEPPVPFKMDDLSNNNIKRITEVLSNTFVDTGSSSFALPTKYSFFEMLDIGMIDHLNLSDNWSANDPTKSLAATIGIDKYGEPFKLDLHERAHGPHGLVAGMTGSGKSEFIIAYILSMAVSYHPYEVAFILIDYKGGGMAKSFENIPHTAGVITNLDGNGIKRSLSSMRSELHRRERIFSEASKKHNISNIDIYKYQKLYREGKVNEPLPHLFIISDEFAELKKEQPDFMTELTSTARVGRSLGVHLILATQKPGGVVDDQIRSNSRFRVCLKVQDSGDSTEMLGRPEAASLVNTGRFYLQVGYNEIFEIGQSAWAGAPYYPSAKVIKNRDDAVSVINTNGRIIAEANTDRFAMFKDPPKQLDVITDYIAQYCEKENIKQWKMWLDPIPALIYVDDLVKQSDYKAKKFILAPVVGKYDDPAHQRQEVLRVPLTDEGNVVIYGSAGNGKTMFIEAMCYSLMTEHTPQEVNIYILDFGSEILTAFSESPFIGDVILSHETEKVDNVFKLMKGKLETRKKILSQTGESLDKYNCYAEKPEPNLIVIINNYAAFAEMYEEKVGDISYLSREGTKYGIYFVLACTGVNNVRFSMLQNFKLLYCLQLNNTDDYSSVVGKTEGLYPEKFIGRGLLRFDKDNLFEFQAASITKEESLAKFIRTFSKSLSEKYSGVSAVRVPVLPERVSENLLSEYCGDLKKIPIGVEKNTLEISYFDFTQSVVNLVLSINQEWKKFVDALSSMITARCDVEVFAFLPNNNRKSVTTDSLKVYEKDEDCVKGVFELFDIVLRRNNSYKDCIANGEQLPEFKPIFVIIQSISQLKNVLERHKDSDNSQREADDDTPFNRLCLAMEKCTKEYNVYFLIAESLNSLTPFTADRWYKTHLNGNNGIWIGSGVSSQYRLTVNKKPQGYSSEINSDFGYSITNASAVLVKFLQ